jgi:hypothetical protein
MDLKDFITETISSISDATISLQNKYASQGVIVNPPTDSSRSNSYEDDRRFVVRRVESVHFDVAVTATSATTGGAQAGLKVLSVEFGGKGSHAREHENVSRVQFSIPLALPPTKQEEDNKQKQAEAERRWENSQSDSSGGWMTS